MNTHYGVIAFSGDTENDHPDEKLRGTGPSLELIAAGDEDHCWRALRHWTNRHPLGRDQSAEVLIRTINS